MTRDATFGSCGLNLRSAVTQAKQTEATAQAVLCATIWPHFYFVVAVAGRVVLCVRACVRSCVLVAPGFRGLAAGTAADVTND